MVKVSQPKSLGKVRERSWLWFKKKKKRTIFWSVTWFNFSPLHNNSCFIHSVTQRVHYFLRCHWILTNVTLECYKWWVASSFRMNIIHRNTWLWCTAWPCSVDTTGNWLNLTPGNVKTLLIITVCLSLSYTHTQASPHTHMPLYKYLMQRWCWIWKN